jgi:Transposase IS66 family
VSWPVWLVPGQKHFFTGVRRPKVPPTNNQAERSLRPVLTLRKVIQGTRSNKGLENHSVVLQVKFSRAKLWPDIRLILEKNERAR